MIGYTAVRMIQNAMNKPNNNNSSHSYHSNHNRRSHTTSTSTYIDAATSQLNQIKYKQEEIKKFQNNYQNLLQKIDSIETNEKYQLAKPEYRAKAIKSIQHLLDQRKLLDHAFYPSKEEVKALLVKQLTLSINEINDLRDQLDQLTLIGIHTIWYDKLSEYCLLLQKLDSSFEPLISQSLKAYEIHTNRTKRLILLSDHLLHHCLRDAQASMRGFLNEKDRKYLSKLAVNIDTDVEIRHIFMDLNDADVAEVSKHLKDYFCMNIKKPFSSHLFACGPSRLELKQHVVGLELDNFKDFLAGLKNKRDCSYN